MSNQPEQPNKPASRKVRAFFQEHMSVMVCFETAQTDPEEILEEAWQYYPGSICAQCSGWGPSDVKWSREDDGEVRPTEILDENDNTLWDDANEPPALIQ